MTYYVGFPKSLPAVSGEQLNLTFCSRWQLSRYDSAIEEIKTILKKVILLTIETGSVTGISILFDCSNFAAKYVHLSHHRNRIFFTNNLSGLFNVLPSPYGYHWKGSRQFDARPDQ